MTTPRPVLTIVLTLGLLAASLAADAQPAGKVRRIGYLMANPPTAALHLHDAFRRALRELGYVEGQSITIEYRSGEGRYDRLPDLAAELVRLKVDIIVAASTAPALAAKQATSTIPIVFVAAGAPVETGLVASLSQPGGNVTGLSLTSSDLAGKRLELLKEVVPGVIRVAVLSNPDNRVSAPILRETEIAARSLGLELQLLEVRDPQEFDAAFSAARRERAGALIELPDAIFLTHRRRIADLALKSRMPTLLGWREHVEAGGLMSYAPHLANLYWRAAIYVDKILKGAKPADLPVEQPTRFELVVNLKIAKVLGLTIPPSVLARADEVIE
jgi:putative ABC transport system substrate-binding protein